MHLGIPTKWESSHWFQRWEKVLPGEGEIAFLDRSWYTRSVIEPVMGYCTENQYKYFMSKVNSWEDKIIDDGTEIIKFYFSLSKDQQERRIHARELSELKYWKLSENDKKIMNKWDIFTLYKDRMFKKTGRENSPWVIINSNNKMIARLTALRYFLNETDYENKKLLKPLKWSENIANYSAKIEGVRFENLNYDQYMILTKYSDDT